MPRYLVRKNCEYSLEVEAENPDKALEEAGRHALEKWIEAWSPSEVEVDTEYFQEKKGDE